MIKKKCECNNRLQSSDQFVASPKKLLMKTLLLMYNSNCVFLDIGHSQNTGKCYFWALHKGREKIVRFLPVIHSPETHNFLKTKSQQAILVALNCAYRDFWLILLGGVNFICFPLGEHGPYFWNPSYIRQTPAGPVIQQHLDSCQ
jgi:hypothetical protein